MTEERSQHPWYLLVVVLLLVGIGAGLLLRQRLKNPGADLVLASGQSGGIYVELGAEFESLIESQLPALRIEHRPTEGSRENARLVEEGVAQLALIQNDIPASRVIRAIAPIHQDYLHFLVRRDSGIRGLRDLRGRRFVTGLPGSGSRPIVQALLDYFSILGKAEIVPLSVAEGIAALEAGEADALLLMLGFRSPAVLDLLRYSAEVELLSLPEAEVEALDGFRLVYPWCEIRSLPPFAYGDQPEKAVATLSIQTILVTHEEVPARVVLSITEELFAHRSELVYRHPATAEMTESFSPSSVSFPLHPGAKQYFSRTEPGFLVRYAEAGAFLLSLMLAGYGLFRAVRKWLSQRQKDRIDRYYLEIEGFLRELEEPAALSTGRVAAIAREIRHLRHTAFRQLAGEKLLPDASFRILQHLLEQCEARLQRVTNRR